MVFFDALRFWKLRVEIPISVHGFRSKWEAKPKEPSARKGRPVLRTRIPLQVERQAEGALSSERTSWKPFRMCSILLDQKYSVLIWSLARGTCCCATCWVGRKPSMGVECK